MVLSLFVVALGYSCSDDNDFVIRGEIKELGNQTVEITYYAAGGVKVQETPANKGKFEFRAFSSNPTLVTLAIPGSSPLAYIIIKNGEEVTVKGNSADPYELSVKGNSASADLSAFMRDNAAALRNGAVGEINGAVANYIRSNPSNPAAGALLVTRFSARGNEAVADSLLRMLAPEGRPAGVMQGYGAMLSRQVSAEAGGNVNAITLYAGGDTVARLIPSRQSYSLIAFTGTARLQRDSIKPWLGLLSDSLPRRRLKVLEISMAPDSSSWGQSISGDSARWSHAWSPGGTAAPQIKKLNVPFEPYFIVCDSTGAQLYRGGSVSLAAGEITRRLKVTRLRP